MAEPDDLPEVEASDERRTPEIDMEEDQVEALEVEYSIRAPDDWVSSGPLGPEGAGPGRHFETWGAAERWARKFYGLRFKGRITEAARADGNRWAFLIRGRGQKNG